MAIEYNNNEYYKAIAGGLKDEFLRIAPKGRWAWIGQYSPHITLSAWYYSWMVKLTFEPNHIELIKLRRNNHGGTYAIIKYDYKSPTMVDDILREMIEGTTVKRGTKHKSKNIVQ